MPRSGLKLIPLPSDTEQQQSHKMSGKEILEKALKGHKASVKQTSKGTMDGTSMPQTQSKNENSQSIVDELFKDFISQKMTKTSKSSSADVEAASSDRGRTSISEMSRLLDMEISSIQAQSKDGTDTTQNGEEDKNSKSLKSLFQKQKLHSEKTEESLSQSLKDIEETTTKEQFPPVKKPCLSSDSVSFPSDVFSHHPETHETDHSQTASHHVNDEECKTLSGQAAIDEAPSVKSAFHSHEKKLISNPFSLTKKPGVPIQLGCKLTTQSLNLIQSTDKIDRKGRVWEEGEVQSSHSEQSDKDRGASESDRDNNVSDTGSIASNDGDSKHRASKHKKKHKHKHKKKKKKSAKDKEKSRGRSLESDKKKESSRQKVKGNDDKDKREDESGSSQSRSGRHGDKGDQATDTPVDEKGRHDTKSSSSKEKDESKRSEKRRKRKGDRSRSPKHHKRSKSRSRSRSRSPKKSKKDSSPKRSSARSQFDEYDARYYGDNPPKRDKSHSRSPEKSEGKSSRSKRSRSGDSDSDLRLRIDKAKLRKIAIANALNNLKSGQGPQLDMVTAKSGGKSVEELTDFCKRISEKDKDRDHDVSDSSVEDPDLKSDDDDELPIHHPFKVRDTSSSNIIMNIRNAKQLPILSNSEKQAQQATLRLAFPVSSGSHHRATESEWVPVEKTKAVSSTTVSKAVTTQAAIESPKVEEPKVFPEPKSTHDIDIGSIISERLHAVRKLQENPYDVQALTTIHKAQEKATQWATSKHLPGQFLGSTGAKVMSQEEIIGDRHHQAWAKKSQFTKAAPISGGIGLFLLQKMGWKHGEGLGKNNEGSREPLQLDFKIDRKGLTTALDNPKAKPQVVNVPRAKDLSNKHPVSALMELCNRRRWGAPAFTVVLEEGPDHKKNFLFKVKVNNVEYQPSVPSSNKKSAKAQCAAVCLQEMGLLPRDAPMNY